MKSPISLLSVGKAAGGIKSLADAGAATQLAFEGMLGAISPLTLAIAGIGAASFLVWKAWKAYDNYIQEQVQAAQEAGSAWQESSDSIEEYKNRIVELRGQLASGSLTESEAYQAKSELLSIQEMLTESYGSQAEGIDLVNGSLREQIGLIEHLNQSNANKYLNENQEGINKATKEMEKQRHYFLGSYFDTEGDPASEAIKKALKASQEKYGDLITSGDIGNGEMYIYFDGDASQAEAALNDFMTDVREASDELGGDYAYILDAIFNTSASGLEDANEILDKYQDIYEQAKAAELASDSTQYKGTNGEAQTAAKWMSDYSKAVEKYNEALASGDTSKISEAKTEFEAVDESVKSLISSDMSGYADSFNEISSQLNTAAISAYAFKDAINGVDTSDGAKEISNAAKELKDLKLDDKDFIYAFETDGVQEGEEQINALVQAALDAGVISDTSSESLQSLANMLIELGVVSGEPVEGMENTTASMSDMRTKAESLVKGLNTVQSALGSQQNGKSVSLADFNSEELEDYRGALEYVNGTMQLNADKVAEIAKAKAEEQVAINNTNKALAQSQYLENAKQIEKYREQLRNASFAEGETADSIQSSIDALLSENSAIADTCAQYDLLSSSIQEAVGAYQHWLNAQSASDYGDMANDAVSAIQQIRDTYDANSDIYGNFGSKKFDAAVDFIVPDSVDSEDVAAIESYMANFKEYLKFDDDGVVEGLDIDKFLKKSVDAGLMSYSDDEGFKVLGGKKMEDFAEGLNLSSGVVQAFFDELQLKGADFDWGDEAVKTIGDLAVEANEAAESLRQMDGNSNLKIKMDVSDLSTTEEQISALDATIAEMDGIKARPDVDASSIDNANAVIQYCLSQKQLLSQPDVMRVDTSQVEGEIANALSLLQQFQNAQNDLEIKSKIGADTSDAEAKISSLTTEIQGLSPDIKANLSLDTTSTESIKTSIAGLSAETINVKANVDASAITGYNPESKTCSVIYDPKTDLLPESFSSINRTVNYVANTANLPSSFSTITRYVRYVKTGDVQVNGTAHAGGTARAGGDWGTAPGGKTLVGELGREIVVDPRTGQWYTVGDNGAEFRDIPAGAIVFNHRQTESLLQNGYVAGRASALVSGTAMVTGGYKPYKPNSNSTSRKPKKSKKSSSSGSSSKSSGSSSSSSSEKEFEEVFDLIAIAIDRATEAIDRLKVTAESAFQTLSTRNKSIVQEMSAIANKIDIETQAYSGYMAKANSIGLDESWARKIRDGSIEISTVTDEDLADKIKDYQDFYEKAIKAKDAVAELHEEIADLYKDRFDNLSNDFENQLSLLEHLTNTYDNGIDDLEERGYLASTKFYEALQKVEKQNIDVQKKELDALVQSMSEAVNSGEIKEGSEAWYDMQKDINSVKESIQESETALVKFQNSIRETKWERFEYLQEQISNITDEANFMIDLMENSNLFTDNGKFTDTGMATLGLRGQNYNVYMAQADKYAEELKKINAEIANDPNNTKLLNHRQELLESQRDAILAAEDEKQAIKDLVAEGIEKELDALQDLIDKYTDAMDTAKDLHDYQKDIEKQSSEIAKLQKQLVAYSGDNSEETKATIQKIQVDLADAMDDLEETQYEHYISEQKKLLDNLYTEYEAILNERLDNIDALMADMIAAINSNSANISSTLQAQSDKVGYDLTAAMKSIWSNEGGAFSIITKYGESFLTQMTSVNDVITKIAYKIGAMVKESDKTANSTISSAKPSTNTNASAKPPTTTNTTTTKPATNNTPKFNEDIKRGIAAAIWIYGSKAGWGNNPKRSGRLISKFGAANAAAVQSYINAHANNGDLYNYWVSTGKSNLSQYYYSAFKKGGLADYTGMAWLDGTPTEPEMVLNADDTQNFIALKDAMKSIADGNNPFSQLFSGEEASDNILSQLSKLSTPISGKETNIGDITYQVTIPIEHVQDYNDFMNQMRSDGKFEKMIRSMTVDQLSGGSKLSKNKYQW